MDAMVVQLDSSTTARASPLELFAAAWRGRVAAAAAAAAADSTMVLQSSTGARDAALMDAASVPRCATADPRFNALMEGRLCVLFDHEYRRDAAEAEAAATVASKDPRATVTAPTRIVDTPNGVNNHDSNTTSNSFRFTKPRPSVTFQLPNRGRASTAAAAAARAGQPSPSPLKRRRHWLDVDGPNTADLCCKKRRLRTKLITSRLSQPYSQPATHILNREGQKQGDKRFHKMATAVDVARRHAHPQTQSTSFFKYSVMNRLRQRLGLGRSMAQQAGHGHGGHQEAADEEATLNTTTKAPWKTEGDAQTASSPLRSQNRPPHRTAHPAAAAAATVTTMTTRCPLGSGTPPRRQSARFSKPAALPLPPSDLAATKVRTSPRIHAVRSPELRPDKGAGVFAGSSYEDLEEDGFAFLHGDDENLSDLTDDPDHVYSDFGVIFGGTAGDDDDDYSYEEYLDELDGISWVTM